jgi:hypothetical protein
VPITQSDGRQFYLNAVVPTPDRLLGYIGDPPADPSTQGLQNPVAAMLSLVDASTMPIVKLDPSAAQGGFDADDAYVVWIQASDQRSIDWRLYSKRISSPSGPVVLAKAPAGGSTAPGSFVFPHIDHDTVVWSETDGQTSNVYVTDASGAPPRLVASDASNPQIAWPVVAYAEHQSPSAPIDQFVIGVSNLGSNSRMVMSEVQSPSSWAISSRGLAWVDSKRKKLYEMDFATGRQRMIADVSKSITNYIQFPAMNDRYVAWSQEGGEWIFDTKTGTSIQLSDHRLFNSVWLHGNTLAWPVAIPQSDPAWKPWNGLRGYYVVDTRTLN